MKELMEYNQSITYNERFRFIIKEAEITSYLLERGYKIIEHIAAKDMENRYLTLKMVHLPEEC